MRRYFRTLMALAVCAVLFTSTAHAAPNCDFGFPVLPTTSLKPCPNDWACTQEPGQIPAEWQIQVAADEARWEIYRAIYSGRLVERDPKLSAKNNICWHILPVVYLLPCAFRVPGGWYIENGQVVRPPEGVCAQETSFYYYYEVYVTSRVPSRVLPLAKNGVYNIYLMHLGRWDLIDQWHPNFVDPLAPKPVRRRSVGR